MLQGMQARWGAWLAGLLLAACAVPELAPVSPPPTVPPMPEGASGYTAKPGWSTQRFAVAAAHPLAAEAGAKMLRAGGTAVDAAVAVQMVLALVEPQSSGIGGGAFLLHFDGRRVEAYDGRETAPAAADEKLFMQADGTPMPFAAMVASGKSVGVPGAVRMLEAVHRQHGRLPWAKLFEPAIRLADEGFAISPRMAEALKDGSALRQDPQAGAFFFSPDGKPWPAGHWLRNPALADVLRALARDGSRALHEGPVAADLVRRVRTHARAPGEMTLDDLRGYHVRQREPICTDWRQRWRICGFPPPSSGHLTIMQILGLLEHAGPQPPTALAAGVPTVPWLHAYTEAARLAFADRGLYIGDPEFVTPPGGDWTTLLAPDYLRRRAALIGARSMGTASPGQPVPLTARLGAQAEQPEHGTSHVSIVDAEGHALAMTTTIEASWGSRIMSDGGTGKPGGFLLNNELTDFSALPVDGQGRPVANRVQGGKRPRSSMSPTVVFDRNDGRLVMSLGSPGGAAIIHFTAKTLIGALDWGLDVQQAIDLPNFGSFNGPTVLEAGRFPPATADQLRSLGHVVVETDLASGLQALQRRGAGWFGGADPRREGVVIGD